jgi:membrane associated rhomboid family serine protease
LSDTPGLNADGSIDYRNYTEEQLFRVLQRIDSDKYPLNFANLKAEFAARNISIGDSANAADALIAAERVVYSRPQQPQTRIAFEPRPGFLTWLGPSRNDFRLVGRGNIALQGASLLVEGRRFGFILGLPLRRRIELKVADIFNVELEENVVRFECRAAESETKALTFWLADSEAAENLVKLLPAGRTPDFAPQLMAYLDFEERLESRAPHLPVTYGFAALCVLMFAITISHGAQWFKDPGLVEIGWGSNFSPSTIGGQWWRLLTYSVLHFGVIHLVFNLWALISFGVMGERLYGSLRYAIICLVAGVVGGMTSVVMNPHINSAGASGVIFGIFGALLVAHLRGADAIPPTVQRSLRNSTLFFVLVSLGSGFVVAGVDNAAHVGGLIAGICMGLAFQSPRRVIRMAAPALLAVLVVLTGAGLARRAVATPTAETAYWKTMRWFIDGEAGVVKNWTDLQDLARAQKIGDDALADRLEKEVAPFWREASERLKPLEFDVGTEIFDAHQYMKAFANGRSHAIELCISGLRKHDPEIAGACMKEMAEVDDMIRERQKKLEDRK